MENIKEIKYNDYYGSRINFEQIDKEENFIKLTYVGGKLKKEEKFINNEKEFPKAVTYYCASNESKFDVLKKLSNKSHNSDIILYFNDVQFMDFTLWDWEDYNSIGTVTFKGKQVLDQKHRSILDVSFDLTTNQIKGYASKYYYANQDKNVNDDLLLEFKYNSNGEVFMVVDHQERFGYIKGIHITEYLADIQFSHQDFPWNQHPYYHSLYPLLPEGPL